MCENGRKRYSRCNFVLIDERETTVIVEDWLAKREPNSLIRLGDGEGMVLRRPGPDDRVLWRTAVAHFGPEVTQAYIARLADDLEDAIDDASIVGVRDDLVNVAFSLHFEDLPEDQFVVRFREHFHLRKVEQEIGFPGAYRLAQIYWFLEAWEFRPLVRFCSAWIHFGLSKSKFLVKISQSQPCIGLISSKEELYIQLSDLLNLKIDFYKIPEMYAWIRHPREREIFNLSEFSKTYKNLKVSFPGQMFFVGAGIWGKIYCRRVKELGGIALDVGAVCDSWIGFPSRPLVFQSLFKDFGGSVPSELLLSKQVQGHEMDVDLC